MCIWFYLTDCITWMLSSSIKASGQGVKMQVSQCLDSLQCARNPLKCALNGTLTSGELTL